MKLNRTHVAFDQEAHTYTDTESGAIYKGITSTLLAHVLPNKYDGIPKEVLDKAAARGSLVHEDIELAESLGAEPTTEEGKNYLTLRDKHELKCLTCEYTVTDYQHFATNIDAIYTASDTEVDLADFKTTSKLDKDYLSWQLSLCAMFFEANNPDIKVRNLYGIWLRGDIAQVVPIQRRSVEECQALIAAYLSGQPYEWTPAVPEYISSNEELLIALTERIKELTAQKEQLQAEILERMEADKVKSFDTGRVLITYVQPSSRSSFDAKAFQKDNADLYQQYLKETTTKASLKLTIR